MIFNVNEQLMSSLASSSDGSSRDTERSLHRAIHKTVVTVGIIRHCSTTSIFDSGAESASDLKQCVQRLLSLYLSYPVDLVSLTRGKSSNPGLE